MDTPERLLPLLPLSVMCINEEHIRAVMIWRSAKFSSQNCPQTPETLINAVVLVLINLNGCQSRSIIIPLPSKLFLAFIISKNEHFCGLDGRLL